jgi:hypothetical protein
LFPINGLICHTVLTSAVDAGEYLTADTDHFYGTGQRLDGPKCQYSRMRKARIHLDPARNLTSINLVPVAVPTELSEPSLHMFACS